MSVPVLDLVLVILAGLLLLRLHSTLDEIHAQLDALRRTVNALDQRLISTWTDIMAPLDAHDLEPHCVGSHWASEPTPVPSVAVDSGFRSPFIVSSGGTLPPGLRFGPTPAIATLTTSTTVAPRRRTARP